MSFLVCVIISDNYIQINGITDTMIDSLYKVADWECIECGHIGLYITDSDECNVYCKCAECNAKMIMIDGELIPNE